MARGRGAGGTCRLRSGEEIAVGLAAGEPVRVIAARLGRAASTVSREVRRNSRGRRHYRALAAQGQAQHRAARPKTAKLAGNPVLRGWVQEKLELRWSPEQISVMLKREFPGDAEMRVSHETIYQAIYVQGRGALRRELAVCLRTGRALRKPRRREGERRGKIPGMVMISERPAEAEDRAVPGHWEGDRATCKAARGELVIPFGGRIDEGVTRFSVCGTVPALACVTGDRGVRSPGKKPKPPSFHPGAAGEGKAGRVNGSESSYAS
jgi:IS30 family transposase